MTPCLQWLDVKKRQGPPSVISILVQLLPTLDGVIVSTSRLSSTDAECQREGQTAAVIASVHHKLKPEPGELSEDTVEEYIELLTELIYFTWFGTKGNSILRLIFR